MRPAVVLPMLLLALAVTGGVERKAATLNNDANKLFEGKKFEDASKLYDEAQTRAPESPEIAYNLGNALYRQGRTQEAVAMLERGAQSQDPKLRQRSLYNLGNVLHETGKLPEAVNAYRQSLRLDPADRDAKINYEKALQELQQQEQQQQQQQQGGGQKKQDGKQQQNQQDQSGQGNSQQDQQQQGEGENKDQQQQDQKGQEGKPKDPKDQQAENQDPPKEGQDPQQQLAGFDSVAAGDLSREEALRILEAMRQQETELQKARARQQKMKTRRVDKDW